MRKEIGGKIFYENSKGSLVPEELVKDYDKIKDQTVMLAYTRIMELRKLMSDTKAEIMRSITELQEILQDEYKVKLGGAKENVTVTSFDGAVKILIANNEVKMFDDKVHLAKALIDKCIERWSVGTNENLKAVIDQAFELNQSGHMKIGSILALRSLNIKDEEWKKAMEIISDSYQVALSRRYFRVYRRNDDQYALVDLDMSTL